MFNLNLSAEVMQKLMDDGTLAKIIEACTYGGDCKCSEKATFEENRAPWDSSVDDSTLVETPAKAATPKRKTAKKVKKEEPEITLEAVQELVRKYVRTKRDVIRDTLAKYNADKVSDLTASDLKSFYKDFKEAVDE